MRLLRLLSVLILSLSITFCSKGEDPAETSNPNLPNQSAVDPPLASVLSHPLNNEVCETGTVISETHRRINFQWTASENTDFYDLKIQNLDNQSLISHSYIQTTSKEIDLIKGTPFAWSVTSKHNQSSQTATSQRWQFYLSGDGATTYPPYPANLISPSSGFRFENSTTSVELRWECSHPENENLLYTLYFDLVDGLQTPAAENINIIETSKQVNVNSGTTYYWRIKASDPDGNSSFSIVYPFLIE